MLLTLILSKMGIYGSSEANNNAETGEIYRFKPFTFDSCNPLNADDFKPKPRSGHRVVCTSSNVYSYGGYNPGVDENDPDVRRDRNWFESRPLFKEVWRYNIASRRWSRLPIKNIPSVLASNAVILSGSIFMVYGGTGVPFGGHCSNALYVCDLAGTDLEFRLIEVDGQKPEPQYGQAILLKQHYLYVIGGTTGYEYSADVHRLNLTTGTWEQVYMCNGSCDEPMGRYRHELGFDGRRIFVLGGGTADLAFGFKDLPAFDTETKEWLRLWTSRDPDAPDPGYPTARRFHSCIQMPGTNTVIIIGGFNGVDVLDDTWQLDLVNLQWQMLSDTRLPLPTYFHSSAVTPAGKLFNFGGIHQLGRKTERTSDIHCAWLCIPKLKEICWEAVQFYNLTSNLSISEMRDRGYPEEFIQRLRNPPYL